MLSDKLRSPAKRLSKKELKTILGGEQRPTDHCPLCQGIDEECPPDQKCVAMRCNNSWTMGICVSSGWNP